MQLSRPALSAPCSHPRICSGNNHRAGFMRSSTSPKALTGRLFFGLTYFSRLMTQGMSDYTKSAQNLSQIYNCPRLTALVLT